MTGTIAGMLRESPGFWRVLASLAETAGLLWEKGWAERNAGNLSYDVSDVVPPQEASSPEAIRLPGAFPELGGCRLLVTAAGSRMRDLAGEPETGCGVVAVSADGSSYGIAWAAGAAFAEPIRNSVCEPVTTLPG